MRHEVTGLVLQPYDDRCQMDCGEEISGGLSWRISIARICLRLQKKFLNKMTRLECGLASGAAEDEIKKGEKIA